MSLENVQPGDTLIRWDSSMGRKSLVTVARITKTQIIMGSGDKFRKPDGWLVAGELHAPYVTIPKAGEVEEVHLLVRRSRLVRYITQACRPPQLRKIPVDTLEKLKEILENQC